YLNQAEDRLNEMSPKIKEDLQTAKNTADDINTLMDDIESVDVDFEEGKKIKEDINEKVTNSIERIGSVENKLNNVLEQLKTEQNEINKQIEENNQNKKQESTEEKKEEKEENSDESDKSEEIQENINKEEIKENINEAEIKAIEETLENLDQIKAVLVEGKENAEEIDQFIDDKKSEVDEIFNNIKDLSINVSLRLDEFMTEYTESIERTVLNEVNNSKNTLANGRELVSDIDKTIPEVERLLNRSSKDVDEGEESLETILNEYPYDNDKVEELADKLRDIKEEADINEIIELL